MDTQDTKKLKDILTPLFKRNKVIKAILFGSTARGTETKHSDIDLLILMKTDKRFFPRYDDFIDVHELLKENAVDMLIYTPDELEQMSNRAFIKNILSEGKVIYEQ